MKSVIVNQEEQQKEEYPCLKMHEFDKYIVLFSDKTSGMVVLGEDGYYRVGYHSDNWSVTSFKPFAGTIELSN